MRGEPGRLEVWEGVAAPLGRTPRAWERVKVGAAGWTGGGAVVEGVAIAELGWLAPAETRLSLRGRPGGHGRDGSCGQGGEWGDLRTESHRGAAWAGTTEAKSPNRLRRDRAICELRCVSRYRRGPSSSPRTCSSI